jgi:predicted acetyltransferase
MKSWRTRCFGRQTPRSTSDSFFVVPHRRGEGLGRRAMGELFSKLWPRHKRWTVSVLVKNVDGVAFWRAMGYTDYELTLEIMPRV